MEGEKHKKENTQQLFVAQNLRKCAVGKLKVSAYSVPTDYPESDGTLKWQKTTLVLVELKAGGLQGMGYTYADLSTAHLISNNLAETVLDSDVMNIPLAWHK